MSPALLVIIGLVAVAVIIWRMMIPNLSGVIELAKERGDIAPVIEAVRALRSSARPTAYNHAIRRLWDDYERPLAIELVKELAKSHGSAMIAQYWLKQVLQVEPQLARDKIPEDFLKRYYRPEVAAQCGPVG